MKEKISSYGLVIIAGVLWGIISLFVRILSEAGYNSLEIVEIRALFSAIILIILVTIYDRSLLKIQLADFLLLCGTGLASIVFFNYCYFQVIRISGASTAALLLYTAPAIVMVLSVVILKEQMNGAKIAALILTVVGLVFVTGIFTTNEPLSVSAFLFGLGSGLGYALYSIFSKLLMKRGCHSLTITTYTFIIAAAGVFPFVSSNHILQTFVRPEILIHCIGISGLCTVLPFLAYTVGLRHIDAGQASILATVEPVVASALGICIYHETASSGKILGMICIIAAIVILNLRSMTPVRLKK